MTAGRDLEEVRLTRALRLWQRRRGHRVATDDVLCAWAGWASRPAACRVLDLGCGHGAVTLMLAGALPEAALVGVEAQPVSFALFERNVAANALGHRVRGVLGDLREIDLDAEPGLGRTFDLVTGAPPFMPVGSGTLPADAQRAAARFELRGGVEDWFAAAARALSDDGAASILMDAARPARYLAAIESSGLHLAGLTTIRPRPGAPPTYLVYEAARRAPTAVARRELVVRDARGEWTSAMREVRGALDLPGARGERSPS